MNRVKGISSSFTDAAQDSPWEWLLVALMLFLAIMIGGYYIQEKYIYKRRFQHRLPLKPHSSAVEQGEAHVSGQHRVESAVHHKEAPRSPPPRGRR